mmetsp:Transcript_19818/g.55999  ORF Transcript_19818/g.55999 Transcript_19818/m.55999 type:complete len:123 (+) Transcript_19818:1125-1493(+)
MAADGWYIGTAADSADAAILVEFEDDIDDPNDDRRDLDGSGLESWSENRGGLSGYGMSHVEVARTLPLFIGNCEGYPIVDMSEASALFQCNGWCMDALSAAAFVNIALLVAPPLTDCDWYCC